jgi:glutamine amidotransferase
MVERKAERLLAAAPGYPEPTDRLIVATRTDYGENFASSVWHDNVFATQFHPEKSQKVGLQLLQNFVELT